MTMQSPQIVSTVLLLLLLSTAVTGFVPSSTWLPHVGAPRVQSVFSTLAFSTKLEAKKKGAAANSPAKGKIQVKLLKHVAGTGQAGQVVMVTPAFFNNKLRPTKSAEIISDDQVAKEKDEAEQKEKETLDKAKEVQEKVSEMTLTIARTAGPDGQLFGGINARAIVSELETTLDDAFLERKSVKMTDLYDEDGKKLRGDIKKLGKYSARLAIMSGISAKFEISVVAEE